MKTKSNLETTVGIFLLLGIGVICTLILTFGEVRDIMTPTYNLTVQFPDASGLLKGSDVYLSGAVIGKVTTAPEPLADKQLVQVNLKINSKIKLREDAEYVIGSSGLLGDRFVDVRPKQYPKETPDEQKAKYVADGEVIPGTESTDLPALMKSSKPLIDKANDIADQLDQMIRKLNLEVFSGTSTDDLKETIAKLRQMVDNGDAMVGNANDLLVQAKTGKGVLGRLINDKQMGDNIASFVANLKAHGPIFYKDDTTDAKKDDDAAPPSKNQPSAGRPEKRK